MDSAFVELILGQVGTGGVAMMALWYLKRQYDDALRREQENADNNRDDKRQMIEAFLNNARAINSLEATMREMCKDKNGK